MKNLDLREEIRKKTQNLGASLFSTCSYEQGMEMAKQLATVMLAEKKLFPKTFIMGTTQHTVLFHNIDMIAKGDLNLIGSMIRGVIRDVENTAELTGTPDRVEWAIYFSAGISLPDEDEVAVYYDKHDKFPEGFDPLSYDVTLLLAGETLFDQMSEFYILTPGVEHDYRTIKPLFTRTGEDEDYPVTPLINSLYRRDRREDLGTDTLVTEITHLRDPEEKPKDFDEFIDKAVKNQDQDKTQDQ